MSQGFTDVWTCLKVHPCPHATPGSKTSQTWDVSDMTRTPPETSPFSQSAWPYKVIPQSGIDIVLGPQGHGYQCCSKRMAGAYLIDMLHVVHGLQNLHEQMSGVLLNGIWSTDSKLHPAVGSHPHSRPASAKSAYKR